MKPSRFLSSFFSVASITASILFLSCDWPYSPEKQDPAGGESVPVDSKIFPVNPGQQICNPSISQNETSFPACMLWLGFSGTLAVDAPVPAGYTLPAEQHDRLTISDTGNVVKWFIMRSEIGIAGEIQDPEWSSHPDYIACLGGNAANTLWDGYAIRLSDRKYLKFNNQKMDGIATPHIWLPDSVTSAGEAANPQYDASTGFIDRESIHDFFGTYDVKIAYSRAVNGLTVYYIDYSESVPVPVALVKPEGRENWEAESPIISPDGKWVAYNCYERLDYYVSYVQELSAISTPYVVEEDAVDPHWWVHPSNQSLLFIIYAKLTDTYFTKEDYLIPDVEAKELAGATYKQQVELYAGLPAHASLQFMGAAQKIAKLPFKGGISRDGAFLSTGYQKAYMMELE